MVLPAPMSSRAGVKIRGLKSDRRRPGHLPPEDRDRAWGPPEGRERRPSAGALRAVFVGLLLAGLIAAAIHGGQSILKNPRLMGVPVKDLEACQRQLLDAKEACASGPAKELQRCQVLLEDLGKQGEAERRRVLARGAESLRAESELEACKRSGARCESERGKLEERVEKGREDEAACRRGAEVCKQTAQACKQHSEMLQGDLSECRKRMAQPSHLELKVGPGQEDILRMEDQEMADEIQKLRRRLDRKRLKTAPGNEDILLLDDEGMVAEIQSLRERVKFLEKQNIASEAQGESTQKCKELEAKVKSLEASGADCPAPQLGGQGGGCSATEDEMRRYLNYTEGGPCPSDWALVQRLLFTRGCLSLPRRRCRAALAPSAQEPLPLPRSLFSQEALLAPNVRWEGYRCGSFACLNARARGECLRCFNMTLERRRWQGPYRGTIRMEDVVRMKNGTLRIGLDIGGATGSFAAHMQRHGVHIVTTTSNGDVAGGPRAGGLPFSETIALRGLVPLYVAPQARLPFFDGVLDLVHSINGIRFLNASSFTDALYEWDRVLRWGGLLWFELFSAQETALQEYQRIIRSLEYKELYWKTVPDPSKKGKRFQFLTCVLLKTQQQPTTQDSSNGATTLQLPRDEARAAKEAESESGAETGTERGTGRGTERGTESGTGSGTEASDSAGDPEAAADAAKPRGGTTSAENAGNAEDSKTGGSTKTDAETEETEGSPKARGSAKATTEMEDTEESKPRGGRSTSSESDEGTADSKPREGGSSDTEAEDTGESKPRAVASGSSETDEDTGGSKPGPSTKSSTEAGDTETEQSKPMTDSSTSSESSGTEDSKARDKGSAASASGTEVAEDSTTGSARATPESEETDRSKPEAGTSSSTAETEDTVDSKPGAGTSRNSTTGTEETEGDSKAGGGTSSATEESGDKPSGGTTVNTGTEDTGDAKATTGKARSRVEEDTESASGAEKTEALKTSTVKEKLRGGRESNEGLKTSTAREKLRGDRDSKEGGVSTETPEASKKSKSVKPWAVKKKKKPVKVETSDEDISW